RSNLPMAPAASLPRFALWCKGAPSANPDQQKMASSTQLVARFRLSRLRPPRRAGRLKGIMNEAGIWNWRRASASAGKPHFVRYRYDRRDPPADRRQLENERPQVLPGRI